MTIPKRLRSHSSGRPPLCTLVISLVFLSCVIPVSEEGAGTDAEAPIQPKSSPTWTFPEPSSDLLADPDLREFGFAAHSKSQQLFFGVDFDGRPEVWQSSLGGAGKWAAPKPLLQHQHWHYYDPFLSHNEPAETGGTSRTTLYFLSNRPLEGVGEPVDHNIWRMTRNISTSGDSLSGESPWSEPELLPEPINTNFTEFFVSFSDAGELAFSSNRNTDEPGEKDFDLYLGTPLADGGWNVEALSEVNTGAYEGDPFLTADGTTLIFSTYRRSGFGQSDLYVSFRERSEGTDRWSAPINLGEGVNTDGMELTPFVDRSGLWFYFASRGDIHRVPASTVFNLRPPRP